MRAAGYLIFCGLVCWGPAWAADALSDTQAVTLYARRFDNAWLTASQGKPLTKPPYDSAAAAPAQDRHDEALSQCETHQTDFHSGRERMECFLAADSEFAAATSLDPLLVATFKTAVRQAAADADAGKLSQTQLDSVYFMIALAYASIIHDQNTAWRRSHPRPP